MTYTKRLNAGQAEGAQAAVQPRTLGGFARRAWTAVLALAVSMGFVFLNAGSAAALNPGDVITTNFLRNWATGRCLEVNFTHQVFTSPCQQGNLNQTWSIIYDGHDNYDRVLIQNHAKGYCLAWTPSGGFDAGLCGGDYWYGVGTGWDKVQLRPIMDTGMCLDSNSSGSAYVLGCNGGGYQLWKSGY